MTAQHRIGRQLAGEVGPGIEAGQCRLRPRSFVLAGDKDGAIAVRVGERGRTPDPDSAVGQRQPGLVNACELRVEAVDGQRPLRVRVELGNIASAPPLELIFEQVEECVRASAESDHAGWRAGRLRADRHRSRPARLGDEQERITAGEPAERAELVSCNEHQARRDAAALEVVEHPTGRVGLVGQPDLDVLRVTRHLGIGEPGFDRAPFRQLDGLFEACEPCLVKSVLDRGQQLRDPRLRRLRPLRLRDQIDLSPVQALGDDLGPQTQRCQLDDGLRGSGVQGRLFLGRCPTALEEMDAVRFCSEHL